MLRASGGGFAASFWYLSMPCLASGRSSPRTSAVPNPRPQGSLGQPLRPMPPFHRGSGGQVRGRPLTSTAYNQPSSLPRLYHPGDGRGGAPFPAPGRYNKGHPGMVPSMGTLHTPLGPFIHSATSARHAAPSGSRGRPATISRDPSFGHTHSRTHHKGQHCSTFFTIRSNRRSLPHPTRTGTRAPLGRGSSEGTSSHHHLHRPPVRLPAP